MIFFITGPIFIFNRTICYYTVADDRECDERKLHARTITRLKAKYANIVIKIKHTYEQQKYKIDELILTLSSSDDENLTIFSSDEAFSKIKNINQLFLWIGKYCSMFDYELLLALVESTECEEAIKLLDDFSKELHSSILRDLDLLSEDGDLRDIKSFMPGTHKLEIKYIGGKCTLATKDNVQRIIYECFHLKRGSIIFRGAQEGCVALMYQISATVKSHLLQYQITPQNVEKLVDHKIKCVRVDGTELNLSAKTKQVCAHAYIMLSFINGINTYETYACKIYSYNCLLFPYNWCCMLTIKLLGEILYTYTVQVAIQQ